MGCLKLTYQTTKPQLKVVHRRHSREQKVEQCFIRADQLAEMYTETSLYAYTLNNPIIFVDPDGNMVEMCCKDLGKRIWGGVQGVFGVVEMAASAPLIVAPEPLTTAGGVALAANGIDNAQAGFRQMWTGKSQETLLHQAVENSAKAYGANDQTAETIAIGAEVIVGFANAGNAASKGDDIIGAFAKGGDELSDATSSAFKVAQDGGKHSGFYKNYLDKTPTELTKAINSLQEGKRGINTHLDKIANPSKYVDDWSNLRLEHQQNLINNWQKEINNAKEQIEILKGILEQ